jgi:hypothetical protein
MTEVPGSDIPTAPKQCQNCGFSLQGEFCFNCGQQDKKVVRIFPAIVTEAFEGLFAFDSRTYLTLWYLISRPAYLSLAYLSGRRASFLPPLRLFLIFIVIYLFTISLELFLDSSNLGFSATTQDVPDEQNDISDPDIGFTITTNENNEIVLDNGTELTAEISELIAVLKFPFLSDQQNQEFINFLQAQLSANIPAIIDDPGDFVSQLLEYTPVLLLMLMPLLALIQQIVYLGSGKYFIEHLVLTLHNLTFIFASLVILVLFDVLVNFDLNLLTPVVNLLSTLYSLWIWAYLFLSLKFFSNQSYFVTFLRFTVCSIAYGACVITGILGLTVFGFFIY